MRLWPFARAAASGDSAPPSPVLQDTLRASVEDVFAVHGQGSRGAGVIFSGELRVEPRRALPLLEARLRPYGYTPFLSREHGATWLQAVPLGETVTPPRTRLNVGLFLATCLTMLLAGSQFVGSPTFDEIRKQPGLISLLAGVPFAATLLAILAVHEFGHYVTARFHGAPVSLPYFIPAPPPFPFGTLGAVIRMRMPGRNRNALFDIAVAGPLAGLVVALPALLVGLSWSSIVPLPSGPLTVFGDSLLWRWLVGLRFGSVPSGMMVLTHPVADAAWAGLFVTALNLIPAGQLDGGRIAYALFGRRHRAVSTAAMYGLIGLSLLGWYLTGLPEAGLNWLVFAGLLRFLMGLHHVPPLDDVTPLSPGRYALGVFCFVLLVLLIPPVPIA